MSKFDKLISKFNSLSNDIRFKDGHFPVTIPKHRPIKKVYIELIKQIIEEEEQND